MYLLKVNGVTVKYGNKTAISNVSIYADSGEIIGFIGADGAGKSSLIHAIAGVGRFEGEIRFDRFRYRSPYEAEICKEYIGLMPQGIGLVLYDTLTVAEHLEFFADIRGVKKNMQYTEYRDRLLSMAGLSDFTDRKAGNLSGGMMQKLSLICTLIHRPKLLILDEPTTGVDPLSRLELWNILDDIRKEEGGVIIVSTAYMQEAQKMDRLYLFDEGEIIASGKSDTLIDEVREYTYAPVSCDNPQCMEAGHFTYSLKALNVEHKEPNLEALFFINAIKKGNIPDKIDISDRDSNEDIPDIVMQTKGLTKRFGDFIADDHIDISLKRGEILGLLGANGAGKTTFIKMLLGLYPVDEGELYLLGKSVKSADDRKELKSKIGYVSQHFALYNDMTVRENLHYFSSMHGLSVDEAKERIYKYSTELGFYKYLDMLPSNLPLGINQRFSIASALLHEPVLLVLDEPTSGVDAIARSRFWLLLKQIKQRWKISILITTHYMSEAEFCDRVVLLKRGRKIADDTVDNLYRRFPNSKSFEDIFLHFYRDNI